VRLQDIAEAPGPASEFVLREEVGDDAAAAERLKAAMLARLGEMRDAIRRGLASREPSRTGMVGWNANQLDRAPDLRVKSPRFTECSSTCARRASSWGVSGGSSAVSIAVATYPRRRSSAVLADYVRRNRRRT